MATSNNSQFGERMSVEEFLNKTNSKNLDIYQRHDKPGYYYFATEHTLGYVPKELGRKIEEGKEHGRLFVTSIINDEYKEPIFMLCESRRKSLLHFSIE